MTEYRPLVGMTSDTSENDSQLYHSIGDKYVRAVADVADSEPVMLPNISGSCHPSKLLKHFDGLLLTGAISNVHPSRYCEPPSIDHEPYDLHRDAATFAVIQAAIENSIPLFCICRGFQELNVAMGGTLETELQRCDGRLDHRAQTSDDLDVRYGPSHAIEVAEDGKLNAILGKRTTMVNSLHRQGIKRLGDGLVAEARAPDGIIEAVSVSRAEAFALGVQWHPEYKATQNPDSLKLFQAFGRAVRLHAQRRLGNWSQQKEKSN